MSSYKELTTISHTVPYTNSSIVFVYIPKTGGTYLSLPPVPEKYYGHGYRPSSLPADMHMSVSRLESIVDPSTPFFTLLRDPYDRTCSEYYFIKNKTQITLDHWHDWDIKDPKRLHFISHMAEKIGGSKLYYEKTYHIYKHDMTIEDYLEWSIDNPTYPFYLDSRTVKEFDCVGITEQMDKTIWLLKSMYNISCGEGDYNNNSKKMVNQPYNTAYPRNIYKLRNNVEYNIYEDGLDKFNLLSSNINE